MLANFPVSRSGYVIDYNLSLSARQVDDAVDFLETQCPAFERAIADALETLSATEVEVLSAVPPKKDGKVQTPTTDGDKEQEQAAENQYRFRRVRFKYEKYWVEGRAGVTVCQKPRQSKITVRVLCLEIADEIGSKLKPARDLTVSQVTDFFDVSDILNAALIEATLTTYTSALQGYVDNTRRLRTIDKNDVNITKYSAYQMHAYDTHNKAINEFVSSLGQGSRLTAVVGRSHYERVFKELWTVANDTDPKRFVLQAAIDEIRSDEQTKFVFVDHPPNEDELAQYNQRAVILKQEVTNDQGLPTLTLTGIMNPPEDLDVYNYDKPAYAAYKLSAAVVNQYAGQY